MTFLKSCLTIKDPLFPASDFSLPYRLTQYINQDSLQSAYETFHGDHHQYQSHQTHHHVISSLSQYTYQPGRSLQDQERDKIDQRDYSDQRTL